MTLKRDFSWFLRAISRKKIPDEDVMTTSLRRCLNTFDLTLYGLGAMSGGAIYGIATVIIASKAGPAAFVSNMLAGMAAVLNGLCYSELSSHLPKAGSAYAFTYLVGGELMAFLVGWSMILEYVLSAVFSVVGFANTLDILTNSTIKTGIVENIGSFPNTGGLISTYPNLLAVGLVFIFIIILSLGAKTSVVLNSVSTIISMSILMIATVYMFTNGHGLGWSINSYHGGFAPMGIRGVLGGAALAFNAFNGFDAISISGEEASDPRRSIPRAVNLAVCIMVVVNIMFSFSLVTYVPWWLVDPETGLAGVFAREKVTWLMYLSATGALTGYITNSLCCMFAVPRIIYALSRDGLLFGFLGYIHPRTQVPVVACIVLGLFIAVLALVLDFETVANFLCVGTLLSYTIVAADVVLLRFLQPHIYLTNKAHKTDPGVGELWDLFHNCPLLKDAPPNLVPIGALLAFIPITWGLFSTLIFGLDYVAKGTWWIILIISVLGIMCLVCVTLIAMHRYQTTIDGYQAPGVPFTPLCAIIINISLVLNLQGLVWVRMAIWLAAGVIVYLAYGLWNSKLAEKVEDIPHPYVVESTDLLNSNLSKTDVFPQPTAEDN